MNIERIPASTNATNLLFLVMLSFVLVPLGCKDKGEVTKENKSPTEMMASPSKESAETWKVVEARYKKLSFEDKGTEKHILGLTMHKAHVKSPEGLPFTVRVGEESGYVAAHEWRIAFEQGAEKRIESFLGTIMKTVFGNDEGSANNALLAAKQAINNLDKDECVSVRIGPWQIVAIYKAAGRAGRHDLSLLFGDGRAKTQGASKLFNMLVSRGLHCKGLKVHGKPEVH